MKQLLLLISIFVFSINTTEAIACLCKIPSPEDALTNSDKAFKGRVLNIEFEDLKKKNKVTFEVTKPCKEVESEIVQIYTNSSHASCGVEFKKGVQYLVYAKYDETKKEVFTSYCFGTKEVRND